MEQKLKNFYNNVIRGTALEDHFHYIGFWICLIAIVFTLIDFQDKYFFLISGSVFYILYKTNDQLKKRDQRFELELYDDKVPEILDKIIDESFNEFFILNKGFEKEKSHINSTEEKEILNSMINIVSSKISYSTMAKLEAYYNKAMVPDIISTKIYMVITAYVAQNNVPIKDKPDKLLKSIMDVNDVEKPAPTEDLDMSGTSIRYL